MLEREASKVADERERGHRGPRGQVGIARRAASSELPQTVFRVVEIDQGPTPATAPAGGVRRACALLAFGLLFLLGDPGGAAANMAWPARLLEERLVAIPTIMLGILLESVALRLLFLLPWPRAIFVSVAVNAASALVGLLAIPASGLFLEVMTAAIVGTPVFGPLGWIVTLLGAATVSAGIEGFVLGRYFSLPFNRACWLVWCVANFLTTYSAFMTFYVVPSWFGGYPVLLE